MKIDRPTVWNPPEPLEEKTGTPAPGKAVEEKTTEPVELQRNPSPKTDSVEIKPASFYNFENAPKLDPSQSPNAKEVPAALIPGVPFREKVELPKTLPNGTSVDGGVASGDLGFGKTRPGPNHMGIDMKGNDIRNQLNDALNLKEGAGVQSSTAPPSGTVNYNDPVGHGRTEEPKYNAGFNRPGTTMISGKNGTTDKDDLQGLVPEAGFLDRLFGSDKTGKSDADKELEAIQERLKKKKEVPDGGTKLTTPDAPEGTQPPVVTEETLEKIQLRRDSTTQPGVQEDLGQIDASQLSEMDPRRKLISNPNTEDQSSVAPAGDGHVILDAKGPDTVNPNDPDLGGGGEPIVLDPKRPPG